MPPLPFASQLGLAPRRRHHLRHVVDVVAGVGARSVRAPLSLAVGGAHPRDELGQLLRAFRIGRGRKHERDLQEIQLPAQVRREIDLVEPNRFLRELRRRVGQSLRAARVERLGIFGDEVLGHPASLRARDSELQQRGVRACQKRLRIVSGGRRRRKRRAAWRADLRAGPPSRQDEGEDGDRQDPPAAGLHHHPVILPRDHAGQRSDRSGGRRHGQAADGLVPCTR